MLTLVPASQRHTRAELEERLDLGSGDKDAKRSAYWIMLTLSAVIAVAGVTVDSTATVIGAMIIAPLATPILGIGLGIVTGQAALIGRSVLHVAAGVAIVVIAGWVFVQVIPYPADVLTNGQVDGRTYPRIPDLIAAIGTGLAGAIATTRRDMGDVLSGVAIAISLVPPLGVIGVALGSGAPALALGAFVLFSCNVMALVIASIVVLVAAGYSREGTTPSAVWRRHAYLVVAVACALVTIPVIINSLSAVWTSQVRTLAEEWIDDVPDAAVETVSWHAKDVVIEIRSPDDPPDLTDLQDAIHNLVPWETTVVVLLTEGERIGTN